LLGNIALFGYQHRIKIFTQIDHMNAGVKDN